MPSIFRSKKSKSSNSVSEKRPRSRRTILKWVLGCAIGLAILVAVAGMWLGPTFFTIAPNAGVVNSLLRSIPGVADNLASTEDGRTNIALLGMRGEGVDGGGLLADTIMVASVREGTNAVSLFSIPRDLYVTVPETSNKQKINAVYAYGEEKGRGVGMEHMKAVLSEVLGQEVHYAVVIDFAGFEELIDALGGVDVNLAEPFVEPIQFHKEQVCDENVFTVPSGNYEEKISGRTGKVKARYPLCYNANEECGGVFTVPAGESTLSGEQALCYVRSRETSSDFDRARRQQEVIKQIKDKALSLGFVSDFGKINAMLDALGGNVRTDLQLWEMKVFFELAQTFESPEIRQKVLENSEQGLLYAPEQGDAGYILLPRGDSYEGIHRAFVEALPAVSDQESEKK
jgi:LCP family protein required for cell wall assembly